MVVLYKAGDGIAGSVGVPPMILLFGSDDRGIPHSIGGTPMLLPTPDQIIGNDLLKFLATQSP